MKKKYAYYLHGNVTIYRSTTRRNIPEGFNLQWHRYAKLKSRSSIIWPYLTLYEKNYSVRNFINFLLKKFLAALYLFSLTKCMATTSKFGGQ